MPQDVTQQGHETPDPAIPALAPDDESAPPSAPATTPPEGGTPAALATAPRPAAKPTFGSSPTALQDCFLNGLRRENIDVVVYFCDGTQERGAIRAFDTFTVLLENRNSGKAQLLYKHAIARIFPTRTPAHLFGERK